MCGICGVLAFGGGSVSSAWVDAQLECLHHRGPDSRGAFGNGPARIGQNRLAIIDLVTGDPPVTNEDGTVCAVLNGEIYNFEQLRAQLRAAGHDLSTEGDTEVIAHLAEDLEADALARRLEGMFAFAVWDEKRRRLILGRDRLGKKPLYYWASTEKLVFASEIKGVLACPGVPRELDEEAIPAYLTFGYVPTPRTFFNGVRSLPPGHVLTASVGRPPSVQAYWEPPAPDAVDELDVSMEEAATAVRAELDGAVGRRMRSDVPLGAFLSGGIDSSLVVALMANRSERPVKTFTIGFEDSAGFDERPYARLAARRWRTDHHEFVVAPDAVELVERLLWHHDQPFGDSSALPTFLLNEMTRGQVTVALCGDGGDELFAGYERFAAAMALGAYARLPEALRRLAAGALDAMPRRLLPGRLGGVQRFVSVGARTLPDAYREWVSFLGDREREALLGHHTNWAVEDFRARWESYPRAGTLDRVLDVNLRTYLVDDLLVKADRMSMAHGLEVRSPFLDPVLLALAARLPPALKARGPRLKRVLKEAGREMLPGEILSRRKRGFGVPLNRWFREDLRGYVDATLGAPGARVRTRVEGDALDRLLAEHQSGRRNHGHALWALLTLEVFLRREGW